MAMVVLVILCLGALAVMGPEGRLAFLVYDDAYYYLGVAGHLAAGHGSTFDGLHPTNGYHPAWALLLVPVMAATGSPGLALRLAAALWFVLAAAAPLALWWALRRRGGAAVAVPAAALFGLQPFVALGLARPNGLETPLVALLLALFIGVYERLATWMQGGPQMMTHVFWRWGAAGLLLGGVIAARFDGGMLAVAAAVLLAMQMFVRHRDDSPGARKDGKTVPSPAAWTAAVALAGLTLGAVAVAGPAMAWNQVKFGHPMPVSGRVVSLYGEARRAEMGGTFTAANAVRRAGEGLDRLPRRAARTALGENAAGRMIFRSGRAGALLLLVACAALIMAALRNRGRHGALTGDALALLSLYALFHYGVYAAWLWTGGEARYRIYYLMPQMMLLAAALASALGPPLVRRLKSSDARTVATALGMLVLVFHLSRGVADTWRNYQVLPGPVAERYVYGWIGLNLPENAVLGARDAGKLGFFSGRPVVNLDGLANDQRFLAALRHGTVGEYIATSPIEYLLFGRPWVGEFDPLRPWVTPGLPPGTVGARPGTAGAAGGGSPPRDGTAGVPVLEELSVTLARLALRPEITLREVPGVPDGWVVYRITRR